MKPYILVVDDSMTIRRLVSRALQGAGFEVDVARDGQDAWDKIQARAPAFIVCDVNMPRMNGIELVELIHDTPAYAGTPIMMLTTEGQPDLIRKAKSLGVAGWMTKPFKAEHMVATARRVLSVEVS